MSKKKKSFEAYKQGIFKPINKAKCVNKEPIIFRSSLEMKLMLDFDKNENVISWGSENIVIPYIKPTTNAPARYFVDFYVKLKLQDGSVKEYLFEVKPQKQTEKPTNHGNKKQSTILYENLMYAINVQKWEAAQKYAKKKNWVFMIITEHNINTILNIK